MVGIADQSVGSVVSLSVLEHVVNPLRAVQEIARILRAWRLGDCFSAVLLGLPRQERAHQQPDA